MKQKLSEANLDVKGKLSSWMEGGFEHTGLVQGVQNLLQLIGGSSDGSGKIQEVIANLGSPRDFLKTVKSNTIIKHKQNCTRIEF